MGKKADSEAELDEHGLVVRKYLCTVLVVMPSEAYDETTMRYARSALYNVQVHTRSVSTNEDGLIRGELQDEFQVDGPLEGETMGPYNGVIFCGGVGSIGLARHPDALRLAREASDQDKLVAAWGESVAILGQAGILRKRKVTGAASLAPSLRAAGARYTGVQVQVDGKIVTGLDEACGLRFGKALVQIVAI